MARDEWHHIKDLPEGSVVRLFDAGPESGDIHAGEVVYICHRGTTDVCVENGDGEHWPVLSLTLVRLLRLRSDLAHDYIQAVRRKDNLAAMTDEQWREAAIHYKETGEE